MRRLIAIVVVVAAAASVLALAGPAGAETAPPSLALTRELIGSIPQAQRNHCQLADPATEGAVIAAEAASIRAMARCYSVNDLGTLWYVLLDSPDSTARSIAATREPSTPRRRIATRTPSARARPPGASAT